VLVHFGALGVALCHPPAFLKSHRRREQDLCSPLKTFLGNGGVAQGDKAEAGRLWLAVARGDQVDKAPQMAMSQQPGRVGPSYRAQMTALFAGFHMLYRLSQCFKYSLRYCVSRVIFVVVLTMHSKFCWSSLANPLNYSGHYAPTFSDPSSVRVCLRCRG